MINIILFGPPGAGKGTQSAKIIEKYSLLHIATGDLFRQHLKEGTPLGNLAKDYMNKGNLVPDQVVIDMVDDKIKTSGQPAGIIFDGFPRTTPQAEALDNILNEMNRSIDYVIHIDVDREILMERLTGRRICRDCGATYHLVFNPPKQANVCDKCNGELYQRDDDNEETVANRLEVNINQQQPLLDYYEKKGVLKTIDGSRKIEEVFQEVDTLIGSLNA